MCRQWDIISCNGNAVQRQPAKSKMACSLSPHEGRTRWPSNLFTEQLALRMAAQDRIVFMHYWDTWWYSSESVVSCYILQLALQRTVHPVKKLMFHGCAYAVPIPIPVLRPYFSSSLPVRTAYVTRNHTCTKPSYPRSVHRTLKV